MSWNDEVNRISAARLAAQERSLLWKREVADKAADVQRADIKTLNEFFVLEGVDDVLFACVGYEPTIEEDWTGYIIHIASKKSRTDDPLAFIRADHFPWKVSYEVIGERPHDGEKLALLGFGSSVMEAIEAAKDHLVPKIADIREADGGQAE
ncbi:MAG: hypothetical protein AAFY10_13975 [Pseudomonadota bacterium]